MIDTSNTICIPKIKSLGQTVQILEKCQILQMGIIQSNIYETSPKGNQVIYTIAPTCMPNIRTLALKVFPRFWEQTFF